MPLQDHPSFHRPPLSTKLWRYIDTAKFIELLTSRSIWFSNAEILAQEDPFEGNPDAIQFPHRMWRSLRDVPPQLGEQIIAFHGKDGRSPDDAFRSWIMLEEQTRIFQISGRRNYYLNCWHASEHESVAMWKIYATASAGLALISNGARMEEALGKNEDNFYLGTVEYWEPGTISLGQSNSFDPYLIKLAQYKYENEVRLVYWDTSSIHDPIKDFQWNEDRLRFDNVEYDQSPLKPGISFECEVNVLVEKIVTSPFSPPWYTKAIARLLSDLGYKIPVEQSLIMVPAHTPD